jgi:hypothetical protein
MVSIASSRAEFIDGRTKLAFRAGLRKHDDELEASPEARAIDLELHV